MERNLLSIVRAGTQRSANHCSIMITVFGWLITQRKRHLSCTLILLGLCGSILLNPTTKIYSMAVSNSSELIANVDDAHIVADILKKKGYIFPMASHHVSEQKVWDFFVALFDGNEYAAAGACGNMQHESGLYSDNAENSWESLTGHTDEWLTNGINNGTINLQTFLQRSWWVNNYGFGYGLSQWTTTTRRTRLWDRTISQGLNIDNEDAQLDYIEWEFTDGEWSGVRTAMINADSVESATRIYCNRYEVGAWSQNRLDMANYFYDTYSGGSGAKYRTKIIIQGYGTATASPVRANTGDLVSIEATPSGGSTFQGWLIDSGGIILDYGTSVTPNSFTMNRDNVLLYAIFDGGEPPVPSESLLTRRMPLWEYPVLRT